MRNAVLATLLTALMAAAAPTPGGAAIIAQGTVDVPDDVVPGQPVNVTTYGPTLLPTGTPLFLTVDTGQLQTATWLVSAYIGYLYWIEYAPGERLLTGNETYIEPLLTDTATTRIHFLGADIWANSALRSQYASLFTYDHSRIVDHCDIPGFPLYQPCAGFLLRSYNALESFTVSADQDFTWTLWDALPANVPEPQAWALTILGLGLAGAALRRRVRRSPSPPAAGS